MKASRSNAALKPEREGILAVLHEPSTIDRIQGVIRELQLDDELMVTDTLDAALRRIRSGSTPRILLIDLGESTAPIAEVSAARAVGGVDLKLVVLGTVNDVALFRDLLSAGASDYLVKPSTREALSAMLEKTSAPLGTTPDGLGQVIVFLASRGGVGATTSAVSCAWLMASERRERVALVDLDLHFGTVALKLDLDPGSGLCEALEQPSRIDSLFIERAMIKVSDNLRVLAAEASAARAAVPNIAFVAVQETDPAGSPQAVPNAASPALSEEDRFLLAREELFARLTAELSPERISILSRGELAKVVDAAVQAHFVRNGVESDPIIRRNLITALIKGLLDPNNTPASADDGGSRRSSNRSAVETAKAQIQPLVLEHMDVAAAAEMPRAVFEAQLTGWVKDLLTETKIQLNFVEQRELVESLIADMLGLGPLEPLIEDETVTDIMVNGARQVYVERRGKLELTGVRFRDDDHVMNVATKIVTRVGRRIDEATPLVDARLLDGSRVNIIAPPLAIDGPAISIRKFSKKTITLDTMAQQANISTEMATLLKVAARCRLNILISGGTGSGKTTLLNALSRLIDPTERTVTIEDAAELQLQQPHVVRLETRPPNLEGSGEITMRDLLRNALRMRPDRIILGEIRGAEALDVLQAMNTGHDGSMSTIHANAPREALTRLENMVGMTGINLPSRAVRTQIAAAVHLIAQVNRMRDGIRRVTHVIEVVGMEGDVITTQELFTFQFQGETTDGKLRGIYKSSGIRPYFLPRAEYYGLDRALLEII